jgi:DNA-binding NtrC family response regulator
MSTEGHGVKRILIVDDEQSMREMLVILLKKEGLDVRSAGSRAEAAATLRQGPVDLVLTDVKLPDGDGLEILRHVKAASPETAVVVMTAYGTAEMAVAARKLGAEATSSSPSTSTSCGSSSATRSPTGACARRTSGSSARLARPTVSIA